MVKPNTGQAVQWSSTASKNTRGSPTNSLASTSEREIADGDLLRQGGEKLWGAASPSPQGLTVASRGLPHMAMVRPTPQGRDGPGSQARTPPSYVLPSAWPSSCHSNFYNDWMEQSKTPG